MTTTPTPTNPTQLTPIEQAEALLTKIRQQQRNFNNQASKPGLRLLGLCNALGLLAYPQNQGVLNNLGAEVALALRQEFLQLVLEQCGYSNMTRLFAEAVGLEMPPEPIREALREDTSAEGDETPGVKRWTRQSVINWVSTPLDPEKLAKIRGRKGNLVYLHNIPKVDSVIRFLGKYGSLTTYQMVAMLLNQENSDSTAIPLSIFSRAREALRALELKELVEGTEVTGWDKASFKLWTLTLSGKIYNAVLNDQPTPSAQELATKTVQVQHSFGTNQVLTIMAATAAMANRLGVLEHVVTTVVKEAPRLNRGDRTGVEIPAVKLVKSLELIRQPKTRQLTEPENRVRTGDTNTYHRLEPGVEPL